MESLKANNMFTSLKLSKKLKEKLIGKPIIVKKGSASIEDYEYAKGYNQKRNEISEVLK